MSIIKFTATKLNELNKTGVAKKGSDGYYEVLLGGLNVYNSKGEYYTAEGATKLFTESDVLMRRIKMGNLKGEQGHPQRLPGQTMDEYLYRLFVIDEKSVCCHYKEVWLDTEFGKNNPHLKNPSLVGIKAKVCGSGPFGAAFEKSMENPNENVCFSIRALTQDENRNGTIYRTLVKIFTWDCVTEPGIAHSNKWDSPSTESLSLESMTESYITKEQITRLANNTSPCVAIESKDAAREILSVFKDDKSDIAIPTYLKW